MGDYIKSISLTDAFQWCAIISLFFGVISAGRMFDRLEKRIAELQRQLDSKHR